MFVLYLSKKFPRYPTRLGTLLVGCGVEGKENKKDGALGCDFGSTSNSSNSWGQYYGHSTSDRSVMSHAPPLCHNGSRTGPPV